jgi:HK97 gp10 family phage protein
MADRFFKLKVDMSKSKLSAKIDAFLSKKAALFDKKMNTAVNLIYEDARKVRPYTKTESGKRVSDPKAESGVPVDTGNLRDSIQKKITNKGMLFSGTVFVNEKKAPYATFVEFGTSKMQARPFIRPAIDKNRENIKKLFREKK